MKRWLSVLLAMCLLLSMPAAFMEGRYVESEDGIEAGAPAAGIAEAAPIEVSGTAPGALEAPREEIAVEIGETAEETSASETAMNAGEEAEDGDDSLEVIECADGDVCFLRRESQARLVPAGDVEAKSFSSSDPEIVKVDRTGIVTIPDRVQGRAYVTITLKNGKTLKVLVFVIIPNRGGWGFLNPEGDIRMNVGETLPIQLMTPFGEDEVYPIEWRTSDKSVATVSKSGVVKAVKPGFANIEVELHTPWPQGGDGSLSIKVVDPDAKPGDGMAIDKAHFPDENFRSFVQFRYDINDDGKLSKSEIASATRMDCSDEDIKSLEGIEYLTGLKDAALTSMENISRLDLSGNTRLESLFMEDPDALTLKTLNLSKNTKLVDLGIEHSGKMSFPDPSQFKKLREVSVGDLGKVKSLDFSANDDLQVAYIWENGNLTSLKLMNRPRLSKLEVLDNEALKTLNITGNAALKKLMVHGNDKIKTLDISGCTQLISLVNAVDPVVDEEEEQIVYESGDKWLILQKGMTLTGEGIYPTFELTQNASHTANVGEPFRINLGGKKVKSYKSSKTGVAKVKKGVVTPVKVGTATITVTPAKGSALKLTLTVQDPTAVGISIRQGKSKTLKVKKTLKLSATVTAAKGYEANSAVTWTSSKPSVATVDENTGKVTAKKKGTAIITATAVSGVKATITIKVK